MNRSILVGGAIAACAVGALFWWLFDDSGAPIDAAHAPSANATDSAGTAGDDSTTTTAAATTDAEAARTALAENAGRAIDGLPWVAELGRATGRVVDAGGRPVPQLVVRPLRRREMRDLRGSFEPEPETAPPPSDTRSAADGRFTIEGLLPRERYLLVLDPSGGRMSAATEIIGPELGGMLEVGDVVVADAGSMTGRIVRGDGAAVAGATVAIPESGVPGDEWLAYFDQDSRTWAAFPFPLDLPSTQSTLVPRTTTDANGEFALTGMFRDDDVLVVRAPERTAQIFARPRESSDVGTLTLASGETIRGNVRGHGGPLASAELFAGTLRSPSTASASAESEPDGYAWSMGNKLRVRRSLARTPRSDLALLDPVGRTASDGSFSIDGVVLPALVVARGADGETTVVARVDSGRDPIELGPRTTVALTVRLTSTSTTPIRGIRLGLYQRVLGEREYNAPINEHPRFQDLEIEEVDATTRVIRGLVPGTYKVLASADRHGTTTTSTKVSADSTITVELHPESAIDVHVVDPAGDAVVGALVRVAPAKWTQGRAARRWTARTNASGTARVHHLANFPLTVTVLDPRWATTTQVLKELVERTDVTLQRGGTLVIRVHRDGGPPQNRAQVMIARILEDDEKSYEAHELIPADGVATLERIAPGKLEITLTSEPRSTARNERPPLEPTPVFMQHPAQRTVDVAADTTTTVEFDERETDDYVGPIARIHGTIRVNGLAPPAEMVVVLRLANDYRTLEKAVPDATGAFVIEEAPAGLVTVGIADSRLVGSWMADLVDERRLDLTGQTEAQVDFDVRTGTARGTVVFADDGSPVAGAQVQLTRRIVIQTNSGTTTTTSRARQAKTGPSGEYELSFVIEGDYQLSAEHELAPSVDVPEPIKITNGATLVLPTLRLVRGVEVSGRLVDADGKPPAGAYGCNIHVQSTGDTKGYTWRECTYEAATGEFKGSGLPPGEASLSVWGSTDDFDPVKLTIPSQGATGLVLTVTSVKNETVSVNGVIQLPNADAPAISSMMVWYGNTGMGVDVTPLTHTFTASWLKPGTARIEFNSLTSAKYESLTLEIPADGLKDVVLQPKLAKSKDG